ncbi:MAG: DNA translocase FtsK 4TM domain-containing protein [Paludibacteraceae bacterium]|nr:DNA translocase FtsK 4TM domain-containing protein [Paludibacteraceae bacterium]
MPRRPQKTDTEIHARRAEQDITVERESLWTRVQRFFNDPTTRNISGILLLAIALFMLISVVGSFFTGTADASVIDMPDAGAASNRTSVHNVLGLPGALVARLLLDRAFGLLSLLPLVFLILCGLRLLSAVRVRLMPLFFHMAFWTVWGSLALGFVQLLSGMHLFFRLGGRHGEVLAAWMESYIQPLGVIMVLLVVLLVYLIVIDPLFIEKVKQAWAWLVGKFRRPEPVPEPTADATPAPLSENEQTSNEVVFTFDQPEAKPDKPTGDMPELTITVENVDEEPAGEQQDDAGDTDTSSLPDRNLTDTSEDPDSTPGLDINEPEDVELAEDDPQYLLQKLGPFDPRKELENYKFPSLSLLKVYDNETAPVVNQDEQQANANRIVTTLRNYGVEIDSIKATIGPTVTLYEVVPKAGVKISKIQNLESDIMLALSATGIRIIAPMPGKGTVGIEVPNEKPQVVSMHSVIASKRFQEEQKMRLPIAYGRTITNEVFMFDLAKTPHLLVAGATGTGKSVAINAIITSLLYKKHPAELKLVMVDPKMVEFAPYKPLLRHYLAAMPDTDPEQIVITDCDRVINTLNSLVIEMENRYKLLMDAGVRNLEDYNDKFINRRLNPQKLVADSLHHQYLPYIVIIIDEYGDFIMQAGKQVETPIARITQKARAVGMHMILATQRPSVNIVTGVIKANIPTRIALRTQSVIDSRTVLDAKGAEQLIGRGDSLYAGNASITRVQCAFVDTPEVDEIVGHIAKQQRYFEPYQLPEYVGEGGEGEALAPGSVDMKRLDPMFADVARYVVSKQEGSTSRLQRAFEIGYNRAGKLSDQLEAAGIVGPNKGSKGRDVLIQDFDQLEKILDELGAK